LGDGRLALKVAANRYNIVAGPEVPLRINPVQVTNDTRVWADRNGDRTPQLDELGLSTGFALGTTNRYNPELKRAYSAEYSVEIERQLLGDLVMSVGYYHRQTRRNIGNRNVAVPTESYLPLQVTEVLSGRQVTVYNQDPALRGRFDILWDNFSELDTNYHGADLTFQKRLSNRWMILGGLNVGRNKGDIFETSDLNNPNFQFRQGVIGNDVPFSFKVSGLYQAPYGISVSGSAQHFRGFPELTTVLVGTDTVRLTQVSQSLAVEPRATRRLPDVNIIDLSIRRSFPSGQLSVEPVLDIYNLTNSSPIQSRTTQLGPTYGRASSILRGRMWRLGVSVKF
jgi:hypothetical protein